MKIVELHRNPFAKHEHYVLRGEASPIAALIVLHIDGEPLIGGLPPDISRLYVDRITGTKDEDDSGVHYHVMIYV